MSERRRVALGLSTTALLLALLGMSLGPPSAGADEGDALGSLLARFAAIPGLSCRFREEKSIALLAVPLVNEGELHFAAPDRLVRHTRSPARSTLLLVGRRLSMGAGGSVRTMDVTDNPALRVFVDSFVNLLSGDREALDADFRMVFEPLGERWRLTLRPRLPTLRRVVESLEIEGSGVALESLVVREANGDVSRTTFHDVDAARSFDSAERARLFRIPGS